MKVLSILNQKGGVGKTTTSAALHNALTFKGHRCLAVDANAQRNLTMTFGANTDGITLSDILTDPGKIRSNGALQSTSQGDIIAGDKLLANLDILQEDAQITGGDKYTALKDALTMIKGNYDIAIIDTPPYISTLWINCVLASTHYVIVAEADAYSITAVEDTIENLGDIKARNRKLQSAGILLTRYNGRANLSKQLTALFDAPAKSIGSKVFDTPIRESVTIKEAHILQKSLYEYAEKSNPAQDYLAVAEELIRRINL